MLEKFLDGCVNESERDIVKLADTFFSLLTDCSHKKIAELCVKGSALFKLGINKNGSYGVEKMYLTYPIDYKVHFSISEYISPRNRNLLVTKKVIVSRMFGESVSVNGDYSSPQLYGANTFWFKLVFGRERKVSEIFFSAFKRTN